MTDFLVYDVFTTEAFGGNQLAVIPDASPLPEEDLQRIAREFNFSESTFVFPPAEASNTARVRIFTPTMEIPFAGHPVIGTAVALSDMGQAPQMILELGIGAIPAFAENGQAHFTTQAALEIIATPHIETVAQALGLSTSAIRTKTHVPTMASLGLPFTITELESRDALRNVVIDVATLRKGAAAYPGALDFAQYVYWRNGSSIHARMFAPLDNIPEDPATGSAGATLAALLAKIEGKAQALEIRQGEDMGRASLISLVTQKAAVTVSGAARRVMQGRLVY